MGWTLPDSQPITPWPCEYLSRVPESGGQHAVPSLPTPSPAFLLDSLSWATRKEVPTDREAAQVGVTRKDRPEALLNDHLIFYISNQNTDNMWS